MTCVIIYIWNLVKYSSAASQPKDKGGSGLPSSSSSREDCERWLNPSLCPIPPWGSSTWRKQLYPAHRIERNTLIAVHSGGGKIGETEMGLESIIFTGLMILSRDKWKVKMQGVGEGWNKDNRKRELETWKEQEKHSHGKSLKLQTTPRCRERRSQASKLSPEPSSPGSGSQWVGAFGNYSWGKSNAV